MDIKEFKKYTNHLDLYGADDVDSFELMTDEELDDYQYEVESDSGNLSSWDHIRATITLKKRIADLIKLRK